MKFFNKLEEWLIACLMAAATTLIFISVVHRYVSGLPIPWLQDELIKVNLSWAQELCIYMFVWMAKFGAAYGVRVGIHVGVDVLINQLNVRWRNKFIIFGMLAGALFTGVVGTLGAHFVLAVAHTDSVSPDLEMPMWMVYMAVPLGSYLMSFRFLQSTWQFIQTGEVAKHEHAHVDSDDAKVGVDSEHKGAIA